MVKIDIRKVVSKLVEHLTMVKTLRFFYMWKK